MRDHRQGAAPRLSGRCRSASVCGRRDGGCLLRAYSRRPPPRWLRLADAPTRGSRGGLTRSEHARRAAKRSPRWRKRLCLRVPRTVLTLLAPPTSAVDPQPQRPARVSPRPRLPRGPRLPCSSRDTAFLCFLQLTSRGWRPSGTHTQRAVVLLWGARGPQACPWWGQGATAPPPADCPGWHALSRAFAPGPISVCGRARQSVSGDRPRGLRLPSRHPTDARTSSVAGFCCADRRWHPGPARLCVPTGLPCWFLLGGCPTPVTLTGDRQQAVLTLPRAETPVAPSRSAGRQGLAGLTGAQSHNESTS